MNNEENKKPPFEGSETRKEGEGGNRRRNRNRNRHRGNGPRPEQTKQESPQSEKVGAHPVDAVAGERKENGQQNHRRRNRNRNRRPSSEREMQAENPTVAEEAATASEELSFEEIGIDFEERAETKQKSTNEPKKPTYEVVGVRFRESGKVYYFDPNGMTCTQNAHVIVETARGIEFGTVAMPNRQVSGTEIVLPLRKLVRYATEEDTTHHEDNLSKETEAYNLCLSLIEDHRLEMKLVDVEYAFDNSKLLFYFTSESRVDFRELVKDLASAFRTRIELRQIGIRDEAKLMGGLGVCGRPFCCKSFLPDFVQVSIKMAKEQNLSLNAAKISGACGRLMCCLRYEYDTYVAESSITPKVDALVATPDGDGVVVESLPLKGIVKVVLDKDVNTVRVYHRDDLTVKGHAKGRHKTVGKNAPDKDAKGKKNDENKKA